MSRIQLRALTISDIEKTIVWNNDQEISDLYSGHPFPVNIEMERKWYEKILTSNFPVTVFGIDYIETKELIGISVLKDINMINRSAEFAIYIGDKRYKGKGLSKEATIQTLSFAFYKMGLSRISLKVFEENSVAVSLYESVGFIKEGLQRKSVFKNNQFKSEVLMSILKEEFNG